MDNKEISKIIGFNILKYRRKSGLTQDQLAELTDQSRNFISEIELAKKTAGIHSLHKIAKALQVKLEDLLDGIDD